MSAEKLFEVRTSQNDLEYIDRMFAIAKNIMTIKWKSKMFQPKKTKGAILRFIFNAFEQYADAWYKQQSEEV